MKRWVTTALGALLVLSLAAFAWVWFAPCWLGGCAPIDDLSEYQAEGSELLDVDGEPFGTLATVNRRVVSLDSLPPHVPQAFVAVEDRRFYDHHGVDFRRLVGALARNVRAGGVEEGGSTITQQLARNLFPEWLPPQERTVRRKVLEARVARQIEQAFPKAKILELYINHIYLGEGAYGVDAAARRYFGKPAAELTVAEAALLGGLPKAPSRINPVADREAARERRDLVLAEMAEAGFISAAEAEEARGEAIELSQGADEPETRLGAYFIERVRRELEDVVGNRFYTAGLKIHTTLDRTAQRAAEEELRRQLDAVESGAFGVYRHETYAGSRGEVGASGQTPYAQGAVVLMDAETGAIRALVGGRDFEDSKYDRAFQAERQAGSAFKPFVYLVALERFGSPAHMVEDSPVRLVLDNGRAWEPRNYTGRYDGPMTMREALTRSKNAATVHLAQQIGIEPVVSAAHELGIDSDIPDVPATALGAASVHPVDLVQAYAAFANGGMRVQPYLIDRVVDRHGRTVWQSAPRRDPVLDPAVAYVLTSVLQDVVARGTGTAARSGGYRGPAAGKTGTTNAASDVWFVGYTPELVGGVWMGMDEPVTLVAGASGGTIAAPVWGRILGRVYSERSAPQPWPEPPGLATAEVDMATGRVVGDGCPVVGPTYTEYFIGATPSPGPCVSDRYSRYAYDSLWLDSLWMDSAWYDEEWGGTMRYDTLSELDSAGIDWPELEAIRQRRGGVDIDTVDVPPTTGERRESAERGERTGPPTLLGDPVDSTRRGRPPARDTTRAVAGRRGA